LGTKVVGSCRGSPRRSCCQSLWRARGLTLLPIATPGRESGRRGRSELAERWRDVSRRFVRRRRGTSGASSVDKKINNQRPHPVRLANPPAPSATLFGQFLARNPPMR